MGDATVVTLHARAYGTTFVGLAQRAKTAAAHWSSAFRLFEARWWYGDGQVEYCKATDRTEQTKAEETT
jgi:hypothetical protein